jgi:hypothetical protein
MKMSPDVLHVKGLEAQCSQYERREDLAEEPGCFVSEDGAPRRG